MALSDTSNKNEMGAGKKIQRIRDILMGQKFREIETQLADIERNIKDNQNKFSQDLLKLKNYLETYTDEKADSLVEKINALQKELRESYEFQVREISDLKGIVEEKFKAYDDQLKQLNDEISMNKKEIEGQMEKLTLDLKKQIDEQIQSVKDKMVIKNNLASLLSDLSKQLK